MFCAWLFTSWSFGLVAAAGRGDGLLNFIRLNYSCTWSAVHDAHTSCFMLPGDLRERLVRAVGAIVALSGTNGWPLNAISVFSFQVWCWTWCARERFWEFLIIIILKNTHYYTHYYSALYGCKDDALVDSLLVRITNTHVKGVYWVGCNATIVPDTIRRGSRLKVIRQTWPRPH